MSDVIKTAEQLNGWVAQLNNERSRQLGMQEAAKKQYENAVQAYEAKYGVKLTEENLQAEYNKVYAETKGKIAELQSNIESIQRGDYKNVEKPADIDLEPEVEIPVVQPKVVESTPQVEDVHSQQVAPQVAPIVEPQVAPSVAPQAVVQPQATPSVEVSFGGVTPEPEVSIAPQQAPVSFGGETPKPEVSIAPKQAPVSLDDEVEEPESFTPEGWGEFKGPDDINKDFVDILNQQSVTFG